MCLVVLAVFSSLFRSLVFILIGFFFFSWHKRTNSVGFLPLKDTTYRLYHVLKKKKTTGGRLKKQARSLRVGVGWNRKICVQVRSSSFSVYQTSTSAVSQVAPKRRKQQWLKGSRKESCTLLLSGFSQRAERCVRINQG